MVALLVALTLTACVGPNVGSEELERRMINVLHARKAASTGTGAHHRIGSAPAAAYVGVRTALLISGDARVATRTKGDDVTVKATWNMHPGDSYGYSSASVLTDDGYFLTAAHCVDKMPVLLLIPGRGRLQSAAVRVVWRGNPAKGGPDLALIHAPVRGVPTFPLLMSDEKPSLREVWAGGFGMTGQAQVRGRLLAVGPWRHGPEGARWRELRHTAPLTTGDSGGPAVDLAGRLLGVHSLDGGWLFQLFSRDFLLFYHAEMVSPDSSWIESLIARDRARRRR